MSKNEAFRVVEEQPIIRANEDGAEYVEGYAILFDTWSNVMRTSNGIPFKEMITRSAVANTDMSDVYALVHHNFNRLIGRTKSGTLKLRTDDKGVFYSALLPKTSVGNDLKEELSRGDITGSSFSYPIDSKADYKRDKDGTILRTVTDIKYIKDVGPTPSPAYEETSATYHIRSLEEYVKEIDEKQVVGLPAKEKVKLEKYRINL